MARSHWSEALFLEGRRCSETPESAVDLALLTPRDVSLMVERAGWHLSGVWGGWGREELSADHRKLIVVATPAG